MKAAIFTRISMAKEDYENQIHSLKNLITSRNHELKKIYKITEHGDKIGINDFNQLIIDARRGEFQIIYFYSWDRITRGGIGSTFSMMHLFRNAGIYWESLSEHYLSYTPENRTMNELLLAIIGWVAEQERKRISERTKTAIARRRALGLPHGRPRGSKDGKPRKRRTKADLKRTPVLTIENPS